MNVDFYFYEGKSLLSKLIRWRTYSIFSHVAIGIKNCIYEAWVGNGCSGVVKSNNPLTFHKANTPIVKVSINMKNLDDWKDFLEMQVGKKYDFFAIFNFLLNKKGNNRKKWFCSELANTFFEYEIKEKIEERLVSPQAFYDKITTYKLMKDNI